MRINKFSGLIQAASTYAIPPGAAVEQVNVQTLIPNQLTVRGGSKRIVESPRLIESWGYSPGISKSESILGQTETGDIVEFTGLGGTVQMEVKDTGNFTGDHPVSFSQGRRGEIFIYQGYGKRGLVRGPDGKVRPVGLDAPTIKPDITIDSTKSYYVARIDIVDAGSGYPSAPVVTIAPPTKGGRRATAISRIASKAVSEIEMTDNGDGYDKVPLVKVAKPVVQSTGGTKAIAQLEEGAPGGDYKTGVVYYEFYQPSNGGFWCDSTIDGQPLPRWKEGFLLDAYGGSGSGAKMYLELTDLGKWFAGFGSASRPTPNPAGLPGIPNGCPVPGDSEYEGYGPSDFWKSWQVYDFGQGYKSGEEIYAYIFTTATAFRCGGLPNGQACPMVFKGYVYGSSDTPDNLTVKNDIKYRQAKLKTTMANQGSDYLTPPKFIADDGEIIRSEISDNGEVVRLLPEDPNKLYIWPPEVLEDTSAEGAEAQAIIRPNFRGKYQCYYRFVNDAVSKEAGGPLYSSLSPVNEVDTGDGASKLTWSSIAIPKGATSIELWRSTADQATNLFRVAKIGVASDTFGSWVDTLSDRDLVDSNRQGYEWMPILEKDGRLVANRFGVAPADFAVGVVFQDRTFLGVDTTGKRPNTLMYSEADEPESVPDINELILQTNVRDTDYITALIPYAGALVVAQTRHCHRLTYVQDPGDDAQAALIAYRGCISQRTWDIYLGTCYCLDEVGLYSITEQGQVEHLSAPLDTMFRTNTDSTLPVIDFSKREWFFVRADKNLGVIRVHVSFEGDEGKYPTRQLVYDPDSKSWWEEKYPRVFSSATEVRDESAWVSLIHSGEDGLYQLGVGLTDDGAPVSYKWRTGNIEFVTDSQKGGDQANSRKVSVVFKPTETECLLKLGLYYNGSKEPRSNVIRRDRGVGFIHDDEAPEAYVDMQRERLEGAESHGIARALFLGRTLEDIYGSDSHISVCLHGEQTEAGPVVVHSLDLQGVVEAG